MVVLHGGYHKGMITQVILTPKGVLPNLRGIPCPFTKKEEYSLWEDSQTVYLQDHMSQTFPLAKICWYEQLPQGPASWPRYISGIYHYVTLDDMDYYFIQEPPQEHQYN